MKKNIFITVLCILIFDMNALGSEVLPYYRDVAVNQQELSTEVLNNNLFTGAFIDTYPIQVPPGTNKLQPDVSLAYNSLSATHYPNLLGSGWSLNENYIYRDVNNSPTDTTKHMFFIVLNGQKYQLIFNDSLYHTDRETYYRIQNLSTNTNDNGMYWLVTLKDGLKYRFGYNTDSELVSNIYDFTSRWSLDLINDTHNNKIYYSYSEDPNTNDMGTVYPSKIEYNSDKKRVISFILEDTDRPDQRLVYSDGLKSKYSRRIIAINITADDELVRTYQFDYSSSETNSMTFLTSITEFGSDGNPLPSTTYKYKDSDAGWYNSSEYAVPDPVLFAQGDYGWDRGYRIIDLNGDGLNDIVRSYRTNSIFSGTSYRQVWLNNGSGWIENDTYNMPGKVYFGADSTDNAGGVMFAHVNNDGLIDIVQRYNSSNWPYDHEAANEVWLNTGNGWSNDTGHRCCQC